MSLTKRIIKYYLPVLAWGGLIFFLSSKSSLPGPSTPFWDFIFKKSAHMFVYAVLYWLVFRAVNLGRKQKFFLPLLLCLLYAASDEIHQRFIPNRTSTSRDIGYDFLGMGIAMLKLKGLI